MNGLVLEGGGMRSLFTAGITDVWMENDVRFDGIIGVSAGATFGCNIKSRQPGRALRYNMRFAKDPRYMSMGSLFKTGNFVNAEFAYHYMPQKLDIFDTETYAADPSEFYIVATDVETGEPTYQRLMKVDHDMLEWLRASASLPILSKPVEMNGRSYLDGGISDSIPLRFFQQQGYDRNVVVLTQPMGFRKKRTKLMPLFHATMRKYPAIIKAMSRRHVMYNAELDYIAEQERLGSTLVIQPSEPLNIGRTSSDKERMQAVYDTGRRAGEASLKRVMNFLKILILMLALGAGSASARTSVQAMQDSLVSTFRTPKIDGDTIRFIAAPDSTFNVLTFLQEAIDKCSMRGGGRIEVQPGIYYLCGTLHLRSGVELHLTRGAVLKFSGKARDFLPVVRTRWEGTELMGRSAMVLAEHSDNVAITGEGVIDAQGGVEMARWGMSVAVEDFVENAHGTHGETMEMHDVFRLRQMGDDNTPISERVFGEGTYLRPCAMEFIGCNAVLVEGITLKNSPFWCIHPLYSYNVTVRGVTIDSQYPNNDGCDPESSRNVLIENCVFRTGDDAVAIKSGRDADGRRVGRPSENIVIRNCKFYSKCNGLCIGSEMSGGVRNVLMSNVEIGSVKNALLFKSNRDRGGYISDVWVDSVKIGSAIGAILRFETNYFGYRGFNHPSTYSDFHISNVTAGSTDGYAIYYDGNEQRPITNVDVTSFSVVSAAHPYYLYNTKNCTFTNCSVNGETLETVLPESLERQSCDVW